MLISKALLSISENGKIRCEHLIQIILPVYSGSGNYLVTVDTEQRHLFVFNVQTATFTMIKDVFSASENDSGEVREEMTTVDALALIDDGRTIVVSNMFSNDLHLLDSATLEQKRVLKGRSRSRSKETIKKWMLKGPILRSWVLLEVAAGSVPSFRRTTHL